MVSEHEDAFEYTTAPATFFIIQKFHIFKNQRSLAIDYSCQFVRSAMYI